MHVHRGQPEAQQARRAQRMSMLSAVLEDVDPNRILKRPQVAAQAHALWLVTAVAVGPGLSLKGSSHAGSRSGMYTPKMASLPLVEGR